MKKCILHNMTKLYFDGSISVLPKVTIDSIGLDTLDHRYALFWCRFELLEASVQMTKTSDAKGFR